MCRRPAVSTMTTSDATRGRRVQRVVDDRGRDPRRGVRDDRHVDAVGPRLELLDGRRPERVAGGQQDLGAALAKR